MDAFDMISEPILFGEQLGEHSRRVHQGVELTPLLAEALLARDEEKVRTLHRQISGIGEEADQIKLALYEQAAHMHFHAVDRDTLGQYLACQDQVLRSAQEFADLLALRRTTIPDELHEEFRALVTQVVNVSRRARCLTEALSAQAPTLGAEAATRGLLDALQGVHHEKGQARQLEMKFARHLCGLEKQLDPVTFLFLDKCGTTLREMAGNAAQAADQLRCMIR